MDDEKYLDFKKRFQVLLQIVVQKIDAKRASSKPSDVDPAFYEEVINW
jgi:hypothetical protein